MKDNESIQIAHNKKMHNRVASVYSLGHPEIYNPTEQIRLQDVLLYAYRHIQTGAVSPYVLDYGAGDGNIALQLLKLGADVVASDISEKMLEQLHLKIPPESHLQTVLLNGIDLRQYEDNTFDMITSYSVLHHIPDYMAIMKEMIRVLQPGGVIFIDHEAAPAYWKWDTSYILYSKNLMLNYRNNNEQQNITYPFYTEHPLMKSAIGRTMLKYWKMIKYNAVLLYKKHDITKNEEGDIHVYIDDHILWDDILITLNDTCEIIQQTDYLVCREQDSLAPIWNEWKNKCVDTRILIARKYN